MIAAMNGLGQDQVRNRGTLGGSLAHADPSADYPAVMLAVHADIHVKGPKGWRVAKARDFFKDLFTRETIDAAARLAGTDLRAVSDDIHASAEYRRAMIPVFTRRALERALARA
jgi:CO/xanthine dehydrogenase FAD-binding subunit